MDIFFHVYYGGQIGFGDKSMYELYFYDKYLNNSTSAITGASSYNIKSYEISGGKRNFTIKEMEVYEIN